MSFQQEYRLIRIRRRSSTLWMGYLVLGISTAATTWLSLRPLESWILFTSYSAIGVLLFFGWLLPAWRYASNFVDVTNSRVIERGGPFARVRREVSVASVTGVEYQRGTGVAILIRDAEPITLRKVASPKALASNLQQALAK